MGEWGALSLSWEVVAFSEEVCALQEDREICSHFLLLATIPTTLTGSIPSQESLILHALIPLDYFFFAFFVCFLFV